MPAALGVVVRGGLRARRASTASSRCWPSASAPSPPPRPAGPSCCRSAWRGGRHGRPAPPRRGPPCRLARPGRAGQRGHGRAHRRGGHRRRRWPRPPVRSRGQVLLAPARRPPSPGTRVEFVGTRTSTSPPTRASEAVLRVDGGGRVHAGHQPVRRRHPDRGHAGHRLELAGRRLPDHRPMSRARGRRGHSGWWSSPWWRGSGPGGRCVVVGSVLSAVPGRRRRPTDPVSAPVLGVAGVPAGRGREGHDRRRVHSGRPTARCPTPSPVPVGDAATPVIRSPPPARRRPATAARWVAVGVLVIAAGLVAVLATRPPATASRGFSPLVGKAAPAVAGTTVERVRSTPCPRLRGVHGDQLLRQLV